MKPIMLLKDLQKLSKMRKNSCIFAIKSNHGEEFQNEKFEKFCEKIGIKNCFAAPKTPQHNGIVERKNISLEELARTLFNETGLLKYFWADAVNTTCYALNRVLMRHILKKPGINCLKAKSPTFLV